MADKLSIWNFALGLIGEEKTIEEPNEESTLANAVRVCYDMVWKREIDNWDWNFCALVEPLAETTNSVPGFEKCYSIPPYASKVMGIGVCGAPLKSFSNTTGRRLITRGDDGSFVHCIATDIESAYAYMTVYIDNETMWPTYFSVMISHALALHLSVARAEYETYRQAAKQLYDEHSDRARALDAGYLQGDHYEKLPGAYVARGIVDLQEYPN